MKLSVVIPAYNEINTILEIIRRVLAVPLDKEVIVVDDCSTDGTREALRAVQDPRVKVIFNESNRGKGYALRRGFASVTGDIVIIQDADLEYYPDEYPLLVKKIVEGKADVVYGTRFMGTRRVFYFYHYLGNRMLNLIANFLYNANLTDLMTCYKVFRADALKRLDLRANGFGIEAEMTAQIFTLKLRVYEVPISYDGRDYEEGKKITWRDFFLAVYWLIRGKFFHPDIGTLTLYRIRLMKNNNRWVFETIEPYLGRAVLETGSGIGNISRFLVASHTRDVILSDVNAEYLDYLKRRYIGHPRVKVVRYDVTTAGIPAELPQRIDTVVCANVLEHIEKDTEVLQNLHQILNKGGRLVLFVPAMQGIYGSLDRYLGHARRYEKEELAEKLKRCGFLIETISFHNFFAPLGWFVSGRLLRRKSIPAFQARVFDALVPLISTIERGVKFPFGLSLVAVCRKT